MLTVHRAAGTYQRRVDTYIALSEFARSKFIEGRLPHDRIVVKPNFVAPDLGTARVMAALRCSPAGLQWRRAYIRSRKRGRISAISRFKLRATVP